MAEHTQGPVIANFAAGTNTTGALALGNYRLFGVLIPSTWTAAGLCFDVSDDGTNWFALYDDKGVEITATVVASTAVALDNISGSVAQWTFVRLVSGTHASKVTQVSAAPVHLVGKE